VLIVRFLRFFSNKTDPTIPFANNDPVVNDIQPIVDTTINTTTQPQDPISKTETTYDVTAITQSKSSPVMVTTRVYTTNTFRYHLTPTFLFSAPQAARRVSPAKITML
jgi:hypothetical protein